MADQEQTRKRRQSRPGRTVENLDAVPAEANSHQRIPKAVVRRLSLYARVLHRLEAKKVEKINSGDLAAMLGYTPAQVRKDLAYFGHFGTPGFGYNVAKLREHIQRILGADREFLVAVIGVGNLGGALLAYNGFLKQGYRMVCGFDLDPLGAHIPEGKPVPVYPMTQLEERIRELRVDIVVLAVPADAAQEIADRCVAAKVLGILNFVPTRIEVSPKVNVHQVDLALEMESLGFYIKDPR